ncbi:MAG: MBL fold metallo-hydrolase [Candidatus Aminicenantes bacterium]|nr:MAG: MBL fold metallo-hydrolase [Candidatus Aminicenantes bacterium]
MKKYCLLSLIIILLLVSCTSKTPPTEKGIAEPSVSEDVQERTQIVLLGTGTPNAEPDRSGTSIAIIANGVPYIIDCGPGIVRRASAAYQAGVKGLELSNLKIAFITHLHTDHTVGYPDLIFTPWVLGRDEPLEVYGPPGTRSMIEHILKAYEEDINVRLEGLQPANAEGYKVNVHEIGSGLIYEDENVKVKSFPVKHGSWKHAYGFRFETPDRIIVISGDTSPTDSIIENAMGCDVLIHEVYAEAWFKRKKPEWKKYHASFHTSSRELAEIAKTVKPSLLILYHQLHSGTTVEELLDEIREIYKGKVVYGRDLDFF